MSIGIGLTQLGISKLIEPPACNGIPVYTLLVNFRRGIEVEDVRENRQATPESLVAYGLTFGHALTLWLPDHLTEITSGDMTLRNYSIGGSRCFNYPFTSSSQGSRLQDTRIEPLEDHDIWKTEDTSKGSRNP